MKTNSAFVLVVACACFGVALQAVADPVPSGQLSPDQLDSIGQLMGDILPGGAILSIIAAGVIKMSLGMSAWASRKVGSFFGR